MNAENYSERFAHLRKNSARLRKNFRAEKHQGSASHSCNALKKPFATGRKTSGIGLPCFVPDKRPDSGLQEDRSTGVQVRAMPTYTDTSVGQLIEPVVCLGLLEIAAQAFDDLSRPTKALVVRIIEQ